MAITADNECFDSGVKLKHFPLSRINHGVAFENCFVMSTSRSKWPTYASISDTCLSDLVFEWEQENTLIQWGMEKYATGSKNV